MARVTSNNAPPLIKFRSQDFGTIVPGRHSTTANPELDGNMEREFKKQVRENIKNMDKEE